MIFSTEFCETGSLGLSILDNTDKSLLRRVGDPAYNKQSGVHWSFCRSRDLTWRLMRLVSVSSILGNNCGDGPAVAGLPTPSTLSRRSARTKPEDRRCRNRLVGGAFQTRGCGGVGLVARGWKAPPTTDNSLTGENEYE